MQTEDGEESVNPAPQENNTEQQPADVAGWKFESEPIGASTSSAAPAQLPTKAVSWTASEYVAHHKSLIWFASLGLAVAAVALVVYVLTSELVNAVVIVIIGLSFGIFGARPPQVLQYVLDDKGLHISGKLYPYERIKSFATIQEGPIRSILLMPLQRFMPPLSVYYEETDEARILEVIGAYIPHEDHAPDMVDRLMSKIRF